MLAHKAPRSVQLPLSLVYLASKPWSISTYASAMAASTSHGDLPIQQEVQLLGVGSWCGTPDDSSTTLPPYDSTCDVPSITLENIPDQSDQQHHIQIQINDNIHAPPITATLGYASRSENWEPPYLSLKGKDVIQEGSLWWGSRANSKTSWREILTEPAAEPSPWPDAMSFISIKSA